MANENFRVKNGLEVGGVVIANSSGAIVVGITAGNTVVNSSIVTLGNSTVNTVVNSVSVSTTNVIATNLSGNGASITSVNAASVGSNTASDLRSYSETKAGDAYTNATSFASNADNISSGTLNTARLPATVNVSTAVNVGANVNVNTSTISVGNSTVNTNISAATITFNGVNVNTSITSNAAAAYSNAVSYADGKATQAYSNATSYADTKAGDAYNNAVAYAASNTYVNTTFLPFAGGTLTGALTISDTLEAGNTTINGFVNVSSNLTVTSIATFGNDVTITGNLIVSGTRVFANTTTVDLSDNIITLNADIGANPPSEDAGIEVHRGTSANVKFIWNETINKWTFTIDGTNYVTVASNNDIDTAYTNAITYSGNAAQAYTNATAFAANADNISSGTVASARLPAGNSTAQGALIIVDSVSNTSITATATANNVKTAYDAAIDANTRAASAQTAASDAYTNATSFAANADNISSGTLNTARLPATVNVSTAVNVGGNVNLTTSTINVGNSTVNSVVSSTTVSTTNVVATNLSGNGASITSVNAASVGSNTASDLRSYSETKAGDAYTNATSFAANADNISSGTLNNSRLPNDITGKATFGTLSVEVTNNTITVGSNVLVNTTSLFIGNSTVNTNISAATITLNGVNVNTAITGNAATAYTNATSYADTKAGDAYTNATSYADTKAGDAYTNATSFAANADNISSGTLNTARLPATVNVSTLINVGANVAVNTSALFIGNTTVNTVITATGITTPNVAVSGSVQIDGNLTVTGETISLTASTLVVKDNMIYMNQGIAANITNIVLAGNSTHLIFTANNNFANGWDVSVTGVTPSSFNGTYSDITEANATHFIVANTNSDTYVSDGVARGKADSNPDLGWAAGYNDGTYHHAGMFRDASDGIFKVFDSYTPEPDESVFIDTGDPSFSLADFESNTIIAGFATLGNTTVTGFVNASVSVNSALITVGTSLIGNTTGLYHTGTVNAASHTTSGVTANATGVYPSSNSVGTALGAAANRWIINANTINASGLITGGAGLTITGTANVSSLLNVGANVSLSTTTVKVGNSTINTSIGAATISINGTVVANSSAINVTKLIANGATGTADQLLYSNSSGGAYWRTPATITNVEPTNVGSTSNGHVWYVYV